jgi:urea ABC transporter ATP-binding protein UrtE
VILEINNLSSGYGKSLVCFDIGLEIGKGERVCLLGRNGVGKTTLLKTVMGILPSSNGECSIMGKNVTGMPPYRISRMGVGYVPQGRGIFGRLTVRDNLVLGGVAEKKDVEEIDDEIFSYFPVLKERLSQKAGTLSGGEQQMLSVARALISKPSLILLDEPSEGLQPNIVQLLRDIIKQISLDRGLAILLVEQNLDFALDITSRGYVMEKGSIVEQGDINLLRNDVIVQEYLGI